MPSDIKQESVSEDKTAAKDNVGAGGDASPIKRGRGRPKKDDAAKAKPKIVMSSGRPRGRPKKSHVEKTSSGKPRGRPKKTEKSPVKAELKMSAPSKPRGRPKKEVDDSEPEAKKTKNTPKKVSSGRPRGRPKKAQTAVKKSSVGAGGDAGMKRGRGRPRKNPEPDNVTDDEEEEDEDVLDVSAPSDGDTC
ncbi:hypothetical protein LSAT2_031651 [Lamellibrachia satsuma]|nr:hypothetical protein LSAT2_031651 [Lamellibrachia satsuma]